jgi:hypothetical protein
MKPTDLARPLNRSPGSPTPNSPGLRREVSTDWSSALGLSTPPTNECRGLGPRSGETTPEAKAWAKLVLDGDDYLGRNQTRSASTPNARAASSNETTPPPPPPRARPPHPNKAKGGSRRTLLIPERDLLPPVETSPSRLRRGPSFPLLTSPPKTPGRLQSRLSWTLSDRSEDAAQLGAQLDIGLASNEEEGLLSLLEEDALMSLVYSQMFASLEDKEAEKAAEKAAAVKARLLRQSEAEARVKTVAEARARAEAAAEGMLRAAARVRATAEESAVRAEASRAQESRAQETEQLAAEARAKAQAQVEAADVARLGAEAQRAEEQRVAGAAAVRARAATEAKRAEAVRLAAEEAAAEVEAEARAEARAERLTRKFAHEAEKAADEALGLTRKYATSEQRLWLDRALLACQSQEACQSPTTDPDASTDTDDTYDTDDYSSADVERHQRRLGDSRQPPLTLTAAEGASPGPMPKGDLGPSGKPPGPLAGLRRTLSAGSLTRFAFASGGRLRVKSFQKSKPAYVYADGSLVTGGCNQRKGCDLMHLRAVESGGKSTAAAHEIAGELIGTREQVLACLQLQGQFRASRRSLEAQLVVV